MTSKSISTAIAGLMLLSGVEAFVCGHTYYAQVVEETILSGSDKAALGVQSRASLPASLDGASILFDSTQYKIITQFEAPSSCNARTSTSVKIAGRIKGESKFSTTVRGDYSLLWQDRDYPFTYSPVPEYSFTISSQAVGDTSVLWEAGINKVKDVPKIFTYYINTITVIQKINSVSGAPDGPPSTAFYRTLSNFPDSASLLNDLFAKLDTSTASASKQITYKAHVLKVIYDSIPPEPTSMVRNKARNPGFLVNQFGNTVVIQPGSRSGQGLNALALFDMMGNRVASLHPMGYSYQWNGKTASGSDAPTGVYFVQGANQVLGKFFYARQ